MLIEDKLILNETLTELGKLAREPVIADPDVLVTGGGYTMRIKPE